MCPAQERERSPHDVNDVDEEFDKALDLLNDQNKAQDRVIELNPQNALTYAHKGVSLDQLGRSQEAVQCYEKSIQLDPQDGTVVNYILWPTDKRTTLVHKVGSLH